jgi:esterase/lipase superfamily enzyme
VNREYHKWQSPHLGREMELLVFGNAGRRVLVFPSREQRFFEYEDRGMVHSLRQRIEAGELQLFCVDGVDEESLYCFAKAPEGRLTRQLEYERYITEEVIPFSKAMNPAPLTAHGCSLGAYQAVSVAVRHPQHFKTVVAFSGRYDLTLATGEFHSLFYGFQDEAVREIMPSQVVPALPLGPRLRKIRKIRFKLVIGDEDPFCENNVALAEAFAAQKVPHELHLWCGNAHRFRYWRQMARVYL